TAGARSRRRIAGGRLVIGDRAPPCFLEIVILAVLERPEESGQAEKAQQQRPRHQDYQHFHQPNPPGPPCPPNAFQITSTDEPDIAAAATSGVARPAMASGTASRL